MKLLKTKKKINTLKTKENKLDKKIERKKLEILIKKIPDVSGLVTTTVLNTKISEVKNKIPIVSDLVKKTNYDSKILEMDGKYITTSDYDKFKSDILDAEIKQKELVNISDISDLITNSNLYVKLATLATKAALKAEQGKIVKLQTHDLYYFPGKNFSVRMVLKACLFISLFIT